MSERTGANVAQNIKNPYENYFQEYIKLNEITNLCISYADNPIATVYDLHGLWGSPIEDWRRETFQTLLDNNINIVSIETIPLSVTAIENIQQINYLETLHTSIEAGLNACRKIDKLKDIPYNIANPHSMASRALVDLMFEKPKICKQFNSVIFNNPYFVPPEKLYSVRNSRLWDRLKNIPHTDTNIINKINYKTKTIAEHLFIEPIDERIRKAQEDNDLGLLIKMIVNRISKLNPDLQVRFIQGTGDNTTIERNGKIIEHLGKYKKIKAQTIPDANHNFSNALYEYGQTFAKIINSLNIKQMLKSAQ